jgi:uncharacterized DUF497 family protein
VSFEWDEEKSDANYRARGFDFSFATLIFEGPTLERQDRRREYGELRVIAVGLAGGIPLTVIYTDRKLTNGATVRRIISARMSNRRERKAYEEAFEDG